MSTDERRPARRQTPKTPAPPRAPAPTADTASTAPRQRIAKAMARAGLCSRRDAEAWVLQGRVSVNGSVLERPAVDVGPEDEVLVDGMPLPAAEKTRLFLFHKPRGLVTSDHDPEGRPTVADYLRENWPEGPRVVTVGRLDINTEGLLLLTNDGGLARVLELPQTGWLRRYRVRAKGETDQAQLDTLRHGVSIEGIDYEGIEATLDRVQGANCWLTMGLREGKNREVKRVLAHVGLEVNRLIRVSFGPFQLLDLPDGAVEEVRTRILRDQLGEALAAQAGVDFGDQEQAAGPIGSRSPPRRSREEPASPYRTAARQDRESDRSDVPMERPLRTTRKHVSRLRADEASRTPENPRKRIERRETTDRHDRAIAVERLVKARRDDQDSGRARKRSSPNSRDRTPRSHASPSALAKRARIAKSGARDDDRRHAEPRGDERHGGGRPTFDKRPRPDKSTRPDKGTTRDATRADKGGIRKPRRTDNDTSRDRKTESRHEPRRAQRDENPRPTAGRRGGNGRTPDTNQRPRPSSGRSHPTRPRTPKR